MRKMTRQQLHELFAKVMEDIRKADEPGYKYPKHQFIVMDDFDHEHVKQLYRDRLMQLMKKSRMKN